jgi:hypothetical protein
MIEFAVTPRHPLPMLRITLPCRAHSRKHARVVSAADRMRSETPPTPPQGRGDHTPAHTSAIPNTDATLQTRFGFASETVQKRNTEMNSDTKAQVNKGLAVFQRFMAIAAITLSMLGSADTHASGGQCKWEGGPGAQPLGSQLSDPYAYCRDEDCVTSNKSGLAKCTQPLTAPATGVRPDQVDENKWQYAYGSFDAPSVFDYAAWCGAVGAVWFVPPSGGEAYCDGPYPPKMLTPYLTWDKDRVEWAIGNRFVYGATLCSPVVVSDTGWGHTYEFLGAINTPKYQNSILITDHRIRTLSASFAVGQGTCTTRTTAYGINRYRGLKCPDGYLTKFKSNGDLHCYVPPDGVCPVGNPVNPLR